MSVRTDAVTMVPATTAAGITSAAAQDMKSPRISHVQVDWSALDAELNSLNLPKADSQKPAIRPAAMLKAAKAETAAQVTSAAMATAEPTRRR